MPTWIDRRPPELDDATLRPTVLTAVVARAALSAPTHSCGVIPTPATFEEVLPYCRLSLEELATEWRVEQQEATRLRNMHRLSELLDQVDYIGQPVSERFESLARAVAQRLLHERRLHGA